MYSFHPDADPAAADGRLAAASRRARTRLQACLSVVLAAALAWTSHAPADPARYWLWTAPVLVGGALALATRERLPLSALASTLATLTALFLMVAGALPSGGRALPLPGALAPLVLGPAELALARAFLVGATAAVLARELLLRKSPLLPGRWLAFLVVCVALTALELLDLLAFAAHGAFAIASTPHGLVGPWEPLLCYAGAASAWIALRGLHDRQLALLWVEFTPALAWHRVGEDERASTGS